MRRLTLANKVTHGVVILCLIASAITVIHSQRVAAFTALGGRFDHLTDSAPGAPSTHSIGFTYTNTTTPVGSVAIQFCANSPIFFDACVTPVGLDLSSVVLSNQTGETGFSVSVISPSELLLVRNPAVPANVASTYQLDNIINPSSAGQYFVKLSTYSDITGSQPTIAQTATDDAAGYNNASDYPALVIQNGGIAYDINPGFTVDSIVPPYLDFCAGITIDQYNCGSASGDQINFGDFKTSTTSSATSQFLIGTNAQSGYNIFIFGDTLTSGNNIIQALSTPSPVNPGTSLFGINLTANTIPSIGTSEQGSGLGFVEPSYNQRNNFLYNDGDVIASADTNVDLNRYTVSYVVDVSKNQPLGVYATTFSYLAVGNF